MLNKRRHCRDSLLFLLWGWGLKVWILKRVNDINVGRVNSLRESALEDVRKCCWCFKIIFIQVMHAFKSSSSALGRSTWATSFLFTWIQQEWKLEKHRVKTWQRWCLQVLLKKWGFYSASNSLPVCWTRGLSVWLDKYGRTQEISDMS